MTRWLALGREAQSFVGYAVQDDTVQAKVTGKDAPEVLNQFETADTFIVRIGAGDPAMLPASVLSLNDLNLPALTQTTPADIISAWVRLWVAGYQTLNPDWDGLVCALHGDLVHWLHISADEVVSSATSLTPRFYTTLGMGQAAPDADAIAGTLSRPERLMTDLRAAEVRGDAGACLGHFIGADLAATRAYWLGQQAVMIGEGVMSEAYAQALIGQGVPVEMARPEDLVLKGLAVLGAALP